MSIAEFFEKVDWIDAFQWAAIWMLYRRPAHQAYKERQK